MQEQEDPFLRCGDLILSLGNDVSGDDDDDDEQDNVRWTRTVDLSMHQARDCYCHGCA